MRIVIDMNRCEGNAVCEAMAPELFELGVTDRARILIEEPGEQYRKQLEQAVEGCPMMAISIEE